MMSEIQRYRIPLVMHLRQTLSAPAGGIDSAAQVWWDPLEVGDGGALGSPSGGTLRYVAGYGIVGLQRYHFMRADSLSRVYTRELRQPGDVYGSGRIRLPARAVRGELEVLAEMYQPRSNPRLEVYETTHECVFNTADMIVPNLLVGDATERYVGVAVLNLKGRALENVRARIIESEIFEATELQVPALGAQTVTQLSFLLRPKSAVAESEEPLQATLQIDSPSLDFSYRLKSMLA